MDSCEPITTSLRKYMEAYKPIEDGSSMVVSRIGTIGYAGFMEHCDAIDAVHASLEAENAELREKSTRVAEADSRWEYAIKDLERTQAERDALAEALDRAYEKNRNQRKQLTEVQEALHRRNEGELKRRWMRKKQDLELQIAKMRLESVELPKDADGEVWLIGDELLDDGMVCEVVGIGPNRLYYYVDATDTVEWTQADSRRHYHAPTVEDVLLEFTDAVLEWAGKSGTVAEVGTWSDVASQYAAKLQLACDEGTDACHT